MGECVLTASASALCGPGRAPPPCKPYPEGVKQTTVTLAVDLRLFLLHLVTVFSPVRIGPRAVSLLPAITGPEHVFERLLMDFKSVIYTLPVS